MKTNSEPTKQLAYTKPTLVRIASAEAEAGKNGSPVEVGDPFGTGAIGPS